MLILQELKRSIKLQNVLEDDGIVGGNSIATIELYGKWQLEPLHLPHAISGKVPKVYCIQFFSGHVLQVQMGDE